ncbi:MAG: secretin and TonB N-terminal domain-containing protein, partial [Candidatus Omnitrophica bacterium]|nr:secretin and TonB N-terminal domain-containing protein [Candidatus Omnitrophota bacterium]
VGTQAKESVKEAVITSSAALSAPENIQPPELSREAAAQANDPASEATVSSGEELSAPENVTLDFNDADIQNILKIISYKSGVNIVTTPDVAGAVSIRLIDVPWQTALEVLLRTYGYAYEQQGNIILVTKVENIKRIQSEEPLKTEVFTLKFLDAQDAQKILIPLLSPRGKISVLYARGQKGWQFGTFKIGGEKVSNVVEREAEKKQKPEPISIERNAKGDIISRKAEFEPSIKSKTIVISDTATSLDRIRNVILPQVDIMPKQVLIEARLIEVKIDKLRDLGVDWGTGIAGANGYATPPGDIQLGKNNRNAVATRNLMSEFTPDAFSPLEGLTALPGTYPYAAGLELIFKKLTGNKFEVILHALEEDGNTNTLSAPRILTLDNQEAAILVGYHTPILSSYVTAGTDTTGPTQTQSLDYYQEIGIRLNVVPQIGDGGYINMIIHPTITSSTSDVTATSIAGSGASAIETSVDYPIIDVREAQTQVMMKDGETIVMGGLLKDVQSKETIGIPFISQIPWIGKLFQREVVDKGKIDLLIFLTAHIVKEGDFSPEEIARLQNALDREPEKIVMKGSGRMVEKKGKR